MEISAEEQFADREVADAVWEMLEALGLRDGLGGAEYRRVLLGQVDAGSAETRPRDQTAGSPTGREGRRLVQRFGGDA